MKAFDAIVIGSGQAGTPLVFKLAQEGKSVAFIEKNKVGGTCLNVGCTPTKAYVASARRMWETKHGEELGIEIPGGSKTNLEKVKRRKDALIQKSVDGIKKAITANDSITFFRGVAKFIGEKKVMVNDKILSADLIFINVGGRPFVPDSFQGRSYLTNETILKLTEIPPHLLVIGGSYIGLEFGQMFSRFGSEVTIIERGAGILGREDKEVSEAVQSFMEEEGISFRLNAECIQMDPNENGGISVTLDCDENESNRVDGSHVLLAVGRKPNTDLLHLEAAGIKTNDKGFIEVDDYLQTNVSGIFALGDCNGRGAFTHTAYNDFQIVANYLFEDQSRKVSDRITTYGLFVDPPLGRAGMTKRQALEEGYEILESRRSMSKVSRAKEKGETRGFMSMIIDAHTDKILGACVLGVGGDEVISSILNVMYADKPYTLIRDSVQVHPTVSELIPTMLEQPRKVEG